MIRPRLTKAQEKILNVIKEHPTDDLTPEDIQGFLQQRQERTSLATLYRSLDALESQDLIVQTNLQKRGRRYRLKSHEHPRIEVCCSRCSLKIQCPDDSSAALVSAATALLSHESFCTSTFSLSLTSLCPSCSSEQRTTAALSDPYLSSIILLAAQAAQVSSRLSPLLSDDFLTLLLSPIPSSSSAASAHLSHFTLALRKFFRLLPPSVLPSLSSSPLPPLSALSISPSASSLSSASLALHSLALSLPPLSRTPHLPSLHSSALSSLSLSLLSLSSSLSLASLSPAARSSDPSHPAHPPHRVRTEVSSASAAS